MKKLLAVLFVVLGVAGLFVTCAIAADNEKPDATDSSQSPVETAVLAVPKAVADTAEAAAPIVPNTVDAVAKAANPIVPGTTDAVTTVTKPIATGVEDVTAAAVSPLKPDEKKDAPQPKPEE